MRLIGKLVITKDKGSGTFIPYTTGSLPPGTYEVREVLGNIVLVRADNSEPLEGSDEKAK